jgi:hypothetical protein
MLCRQEGGARRNARCPSSGDDWSGSYRMITIQQTELVAAAERGAEAFFRGIKKDHNPYTLTMFAARVPGDRAVLLAILAAAWWVGWEQANDVGH